MSTHSANGRATFDLQPIPGPQSIGDLCPQLEVVETPAMKRILAILLLTAGLAACGGGGGSGGGNPPPQGGTPPPLPTNPHPPPTINYTGETSVGFLDYTVAPFMADDSLVVYFCPVRTEKPRHEGGATSINSGVTVSLA